jgi:DNA-binding response OmpR family regulator
MNILLVEPNTSLGKIYAKALEGAGHVVSHCRGAQEAVLSADQKQPDAVVLELQLPGHSGVEFLYEFRSYAEWQNIPVILHTLVSQEHLHLPQQLNVSTHLYKPTTTLKNLRQAINELVPA